MLPPNVIVCTPLMRMTASRAPHFGTSTWEHLVPPDFLQNSVLNRLFKLRLASRAHPWSTSHHKLSMWLLIVKTARQDPFVINCMPLIWRLALRNSADRSKSSHQPQAQAMVMSVGRWRSIRHCKCNAPPCSCLTDRSMFPWLVRWYGSLSWMGRVLQCGHFGPNCGLQHHDGRRRGRHLDVGTGSLGRCQRQRIFHGWKRLNDSFKRGKFLRQFLYQICRQ